MGKEHHMPAVIAEVGNYAFAPTQEVTMRQKAAKRGAETIPQVNRWSSQTGQDM